MFKASLFSFIIRTKEDLQRPLLVVDGYNLLFELEKVYKQNFEMLPSLEDKRAYTIKSVQSFVDWNNVRCFIVFDGNENIPLENEVFVSDALTVYFTAGNNRKIIV